MARVLTPEQEEKLRDLAVLYRAIENARAGFEDAVRDIYPGCSLTQIADAVGLNRSRIHQIVTAKDAS
jgi:hypothetical protein